MPPPGFEPIPGAAAIANAVVDPEGKLRKCGPQPRERGMIVTVARDRIEVRDVERREWMDPEQPARHIDWVAGWRERRLDRAILIAPSHAGVHRHALLKI